MKQTTQLQRVKRIRSSPRSLHAYNPAHYDDNMKYLVGWPGYRTTNNKSGLGYIESQAELAHMRGLMIRWLFTGKFRTYNPIYLFGMALFGLLSGGLPVIFIFSEIIVRGSWTFLFQIILVIPYIVIGLLVLINTILSLIYWRKVKSITGE